MEIPTQAEIEDKPRGEDLNTWLDLWRAEQGPAKPAALKLIIPIDLTGSDQGPEQGHKRGTSAVSFPVACPNAPLFHRCRNISNSLTSLSFGSSYYTLLFYRTSTVLGNP